MSAATDYAARHDAVAAQQSRIFGPEPPGDLWGAEAGFFRMDANRDPEPNLRMISSYLRPEDVLVDVGGGAGRVCMPMARHCREVVMVEPSPGIGAEFDAIRTEAGFDNARRVQADRMEAADIEGDVVFSSDVTYFVRDIVAFVEKLTAAARRRVMITLWNEPPPCRGAPLFKLAHGNNQELLPSFRELLAVLWEMDILSDVLVLPDGPWWENRTYSTREDALEWAVEGPWLRTEDRERAAGIFRGNFDELFTFEPQGFHPVWQRRALRSPAGSPFCWRSPPATRQVRLRHPQAAQPVGSHRPPRRSPIPPRLQNRLPLQRRRHGYARRRMARPHRRGRGLLLAL